MYKLSDKASTALILLFVAVVTSYSGALTRLDYVIYDLGQKLYRHAVPQDVVIVAIDELSLSKLGRWPWSRDLHASLVTKIDQEGAKVIGLDLIFSEPDTRNPQADLALETAIKEAGNVVLPVLIESSRANGQLIETLPLTDFSEAAAELGRVHVQLDEDGIARGVYLREGLSTPDWQLFSQAILKVVDALPAEYLYQEKVIKNQVQPYQLIRQDYRGVNFTGPPNSFQSVSYAQVLAGNYPKDLFTNKIVLVGATASGMGDVLPTPVSGLSQPMSGVEFHANLLQSMREMKLITSLSQTSTILICTFIALTPILWLPRVSPLLGLLVSSAMFILVVIFAISLPLVFSKWLPPAGALASLLLAYPVWSWRKLESANRFLDNELMLMREDLAASGLNLNKQIQIDDPFQARILQVQTASEQLRQMQMHRRETLAFISHDIRAPLAAAIMDLDELPQNCHLRTSLARAHSLAEEFLHTSRAEMSNVERFQELDFAAVLHQAADDAYALARAQCISLVREIPETPVWVKGEFGLLHRAVLNLISNAIKYAPKHSQVIIKLEVSEDKASVSIIDFGQGINKAQQIKLFKRFNRVETNENVAVGSGLGLYFVRTVTEKHGGEVSLDSELGVRTCFTMSLPRQH